MSYTSFRTFTTLYFNNTTFTYILSEISKSSFLHGRFYFPYVCLLSRHATVLPFIEYRRLIHFVKQSLAVNLYLRMILEAEVAYFLQCTSGSIFENKHTLDYLSVLLSRMNNDFCLACSFPNFITS